MKVENWIIEWFDKNTIATKEELENDITHNYFDKGWIDSLQFISFITELENNFKISFSNEEFQNKKFATIQGLTKIIGGKIDS